MAKYKLEYIWLDGYEPVPNLRSKTKIVEFAETPTVEELPVEPEATEPVELRAAANGRMARHRIDPLEEPEQKRRRWRRTPEANGASTEVPARPEGLRGLPGRSRRED